MENEKNTAIETTETTERAEDLASLTEEQAEEKTEKVSSKRIKKAQRREAKAARKAANKIEEKKSRPNNALIALLIFGVLVGMFAFVLGYNYFSKPATIEKYIEKNGGKAPRIKCVICGLSNAAYQRPDGVFVVPITALKD